MRAIVKLLELFKDDRIDVVVNEPHNEPHHEPPGATVHEPVAIVTPHKTKRLTNQQGASATQSISKHKIAGTLFAGALLYYLYTYTHKTQTEEQLQTHIQT